MRNWLPSVALIWSLDSSLIGNGSEPYFSTVTRLLASLAEKPPSPPALIWTLPFGMELWMTGAEITDESSVIAK